ncbi:MAG: TolB-like protein/Tfp pilus assembly protein PilF [Lysobacterales bacterium]|jgi:TolB-like protein/Tfp pilus assembly protein PilF
MSESHSFLSAVVSELSRRKVLRTMGAYAVAVFAVLQLMDAAVEPLRLPEWLPTFVVISLILGFPVVFLLAWQFDVTGGGIKRTADGLLSKAQTFIIFSVMMVGTGGLGLGLYQYYSNVFESDSQSTAQSFVDKRTFTAPENSIAVLPFADLSPEGDQVHFSDGIAEEILNLLAQVDGLHVAARTSSFAFREPQKDIRDIGRLLNVGTILEGSIRTAGSRIRMTAQLINVEDGYHIWSQSYDRELDDVFAIQDEVASAIAEALVDSFAGLNQKPAGRTRNLASFEAYRTGRLHWWRRSPQEIQKAIELFAKALEHDPQYAPAYAAIADSLVLLSLYGNITQIKAIERAQPMIEKALAIDPESAEAFAALGLARWQIGQTDAAESALRQAILLNEDYVPAHLWLGGLLADLGRIPEQGQVLQRAMAIDPLNELLAINYAGNHFVQGDYEAARDILDGLIQIRPDSVTLLRTLSGYAGAHGDLVESWEYAQRSYDIEPESPVIIGTMASAWLSVGELERAEQLIASGLELASENTDLKVQYFFLMLISGRIEEADRMVREQYGDSIDSLPETFQRFYHFQTGLISMVKGDLVSARDHMELAINPDDSQGFDGDQLISLTMASFLNDLLGDSERAAQRLAEAEKAVRRARINGVDDAGIYYTESSIFLLRGEKDKAIAALQQAYNKGWRQRWLLDLDKRLDPLRDEPEFLEIVRQIDEDINKARTEILAQKVVMY